MIGYWNPCLHLCYENVVSGGKKIAYFLYAQNGTVIYGI